jgi:hypothetical protein
MLNEEIGCWKEGIASYIRRLWLLLESLLQTVFRVLFLSLPMSTRIGSVTMDISKKEKKGLRGIKERQVERPEHATGLLKWNAVGQGHEPEIDKLSHRTHAACQ